MKVTESSSKYNNLEQMNVRELLENINKEDKTVPETISGIIPEIEKFIKGALERMQKGGRLFYIGAGTSGRLGILDASECPPTFGVPADLIIGIIAGGDVAIKNAVEFAEDDETQAWKDLQEYHFCEKDSVLGIASSGTTPYVIGGVRMAKKIGGFTGCITCNHDTPLSKEVDVPLEAVVGSEFVTGSTRMKAGTAQKLILNMISTSLMIQFGRVKGNKMVDMQLTNNKLVERGTRMVMEELSIEKVEAERLLKLHGSVRKVIDNSKNNAQY